MRWIYPLSALRAYVALTIPGQLLSVAVGNLTTSEKFPIYRRSRRLRAFDLEHDRFTL